MIRMRLTILPLTVFSPFSGQDPFPRFSPSLAASGRSVKVTFPLKALDFFVLAFALPFWLFP